ncbi:MAG: sigma-70 family RNA polymerase sigma factor [Bacteroidota bacterium]|nr:sigma-70 family RNA polymerase sigma factor [Bacteroidota bacterium]MDP4235400.1 sigma-70 family RNA polymerase sigma factor [Bacteroidota bacterium]
MDENIDRTVRSTKDKLLRFIRSRVRDSEEAEDILQDVFYQFVEATDPEEPIAQVSSWLFTVARNKITDWYRKKKPQSFSRFDADDSSENGIDELADEFSVSPEEYVEQKLFREAMAKALDELPEAQRDVFIMHEIEGIPFEEIARITGAPINTLLSRKRYAVKFLRERLEIFNTTSQETP